MYEHRDHKYGLRKVQLIICPVSTYRILQKGQLCIAKFQKCVGDEFGICRP